MQYVLQYGSLTSGQYEEKKAFMMVQLAIILIFGVSRLIIIHLYQNKYNFPMLIIGQKERLLKDR